MAADRNKDFLLRRGAQIAQEKFNRQLQAGESAVLDRFGLPIRKGAMVIWRPPFDLIFQVVSAEALISLDPTRPVPPGQMTLQLTSGEFPLHVVANVPQMTLLHIGQLPEPEPAPAPTDEEPDHGPH